MALTHLYYLTDSFHALIHSDDEDDDDDPPSAVSSCVIQHDVNCSEFPEHHVRGFFPRHATGCLSDCHMDTLGDDRRPG